MRLVILCFLFVFSFKKLYSANVFELFAYSAGLAIIYDQYSDRSLNHENSFQKKIKVLEVYDNDMIKPNFGTRISSRSDLIHYLDVLESLKSRSN